MNCRPDVVVTASPTSPVNTGMNVTLQCSANDSTGSDLTYVWFQNDVQIQEALRPTLMLIGVGLEDEGIYICQVTNRVGSGVANTTVEVIGKVVGTIYYNMCLHEVCINVCICVCERDSEYTVTALMTTLLAIYCHIILSIYGMNEHSVQNHIFKLESILTCS